MRMNRTTLAPLALALLCACPPSAECRDQSPKPEANPQADVERVKEASTSQLKSWMSAHEKLLLIDVREDNEWQEGHASSAIHVARWTLSSRIGSVAPDKSSRIVLYCRSGMRSAAAAITLQKLGYTNVFSLTGGFNEYQRAGLPVQK